MAARKKEYYRLSGGFWARTGMVRKSLWLGPDHLLKVTNNSYSEDYKRYYFKDIQAIILLETRAWILWNLALAALILLCFLIGIMIGNGGGMVFAIIMGVPLAIGLAVNTARGATCACWIQTAVQLDKVEALCRMGSANRIIERLRPIVIQAQGGFTGVEPGGMEQEEEKAGLVTAQQAGMNSEAEAVSPDLETSPLPRIERPDQAIASPTAESPIAAVSAASAAPDSIPILIPAPPPLNIKTPLCPAVFGLLIVNGILVLFDITDRGLVSVLLRQISMYLVTLLVILALVRLPHERVVSKIRNTLIFLLVYIALMIFIGMFSTIFMGFSSRSPELLSNAWTQLQWLAQQSVLESPFLLIVSLISLAVNWLTGLYGLTQLNMLKAMGRAPAPSPARQES